MGMEVHVKDVARFPGGWAFFDFGITRSKWQGLSANCLVLTHATPTQR